MNSPELRAEDILAALDRHRIDYVVIGAFAAIAPGAPIEATWTSTSRPAGGGETRVTLG